MDTSREEKLRLKREKQREQRKRQKEKRVSELLRLKRINEMKKALSDQSVPNQTDSAAKSPTDHQSVNQSSAARPDSTQSSLFWPFSHSHDYSSTNTNNNELRYLFSFS